MLVMFHLQKLYIFRIRFIFSVSYKFSWIKPLYYSSFNAAPPFQTAKKVGQFKPICFLPMYLLIYGQENAAVRFRVQYDFLKIFEISKMRQKFTLLCDKLRCFETRIRAVQKGKTLKCFTIYFPNKCCSSSRC